MSKPSLKVVMSAFLIFTVLFIVTGKELTPKFALLISASFFIIPFSLFVTTFLWKFAIEPMFLKIKSNRIRKILHLAFAPPA